MLMSSMSRYTVLGISIIMVAGIFVFFTDTDNLDFDYTGIVSDVKEGSSGYTFHLNMSNGESIRCFSTEEPVDLGYYAVIGDFSDDGNILFTKVLRNLDTDPF